MNEDNFELLISELHNLNQTHKQIMDYLRLLAQPEIEKRLKLFFNDTEEMRVYELSDGNRSTREIASFVTLNKDAISGLWKKWAATGIAESTGNLKPYRARYSLVDLAISASKYAVERKTETSKDG